MNTGITKKDCIGKIFMHYSNKRLYTIVDVHTVRSLATKAVIRYEYVTSHVYYGQGVTAVLPRAVVDRSVLKYGWFTVEDVRDTIRQFLLDNEYVEYEPDCWTQTPRSVNIKNCKRYKMGEHTLQYELSTVAGWVTIGEAVYHKVRMSRRTGLISLFGIGAHHS